MSARRRSPLPAVRYGKPVILLFAKAPVPGTVKTRLALALGENEAAALHRRLTRRALETALAAKLGPVILFCAPDTQHAFFRQLKRNTGVMLRSQRGADLGERMHHAMTYALGRYPGVLVIGSDCPSMKEDYLRQAAQVLESGEVSLVLGPATDGGYVLMGASRVDRCLFSGVPWGSDQVLDVTRARLRAMSRRWRELAPLDDVDRPEDLARIDPALLS